MIKSYLSILALALLFIAGCAKPTVEKKSITEYGNDLFEKADTLAKQELVRFNAIDMIYRDIPEMHTFRSPATRIQESGWVKVYRRITSYTIEDVKRSDSLIHPVVYEINYHFDVFGTAFRNTKIQNAFGATENSSNYVKRYNGTLERQYYCDENGIPIDPVSRVPSRAMYFEGDYLDETIVERPKAIELPHN
ncbi:MAG: hypothetical protein VCD00_18830 [Candidatus Hydrogenedentota bacterium]